MKRAADSYGGITSPAVKKATGKTWREWLLLLDKAGAAKLPHKDITQRVLAPHGLADWWSQLIAAGYEEARGLRVKHPKVDGFEVSVSKTIAAPVDRAFAAWREAALREQWLPRTPLTVRKATPHKSIRILWADQSMLSVNFWPKGSLKCEIVPQHSKLPSAEAAERMKAFWAGKLEDLRAFLETNGR